MVKTTEKKEIILFLVALCRQAAVLCLAFLSQASCFKTEQQLLHSKSNLGTSTDTLGQINLYVIAKKCETFLR